MNRREMAWKLVRIMSWTPALLLLFLYTYIPRYGISTDAWSDAIGFTCMVCVFIIPVAFSVFLVIAPMIMSDGCSRYWIAATIRILSALALIAYFPHSYELWIYYQAWRTGKELWLDTSFEMNPQGYTTVALVSCLVTYLIGKILFDRHERTEMTRDT